MTRNSRTDGRDALAVLLLVLLGIGFTAAAKADTVPATGAGLSWSVTIPAGATGISLAGQIYDADYPDEATVTVNGGAPVTLFGVRDTTRDGRVATVPIPVALEPGANALVFRCLRTTNCIRIDGLTASFTPAPESAWLQAAKGLEAQGWVPAWFGEGDAAWVVSREDTEPGRIMICARDRETGAVHATWVDAQLEGPPTGAAPRADGCALSWCASSGPDRERLIREACAL